MASPLRPVSKKDIYQVSVAATDSKAKITRNIVVSTNPAERISDDIVQRAFSQITQDIEDLDVRTVTLQQRDAHTTIIKITWQTADREYAKQVALKGDQELLPTVTVTRAITNFRPGVRASKSFWKQYKSVVPSTFFGSSVVRGLWIISAFLTLGITYGAYGAYRHWGRTPGKQKQIEALMSAKTPSSGQQLIEMLRCIQKIIKKAPPSQRLDPFYRSLEAGIINGEKLQSYCQEKIKKTSLVQHLKDGANNATQDRPFVLPCGSSVEGKFRPSILVIYKEGAPGAEKYIVKKFSFQGEEVSVEEKVECLHNYVFENLDDLTDFFEQLAPLQFSSFDRTSMGLTPEQKKRAAALGVKTEVPTPPEVKASSADLIDEMIRTSRKATSPPLTAEEQVAVSISPRDPLSLLSLALQTKSMQARQKLRELEERKTTLASTSGDTSGIDAEIAATREVLIDIAEDPVLRNQVDFLVVFAREQTRKILKYYDDLDNPPPSEVFDVLEDRITQLKVKLEEAYGGRQAPDQLSIAEGVTGPLLRLIERQREVVERRKAQMQLSEKTRMLDSPIATAAQQISWRRPPAVTDVTTISAPPALRGPGIGTHIGTLRSLQTSFSGKTPLTQGGIVETLANMDILLGVANTQIDGKDYQGAKASLQAFMGSLPNLSQGALFTNFNSEQLQEFNQKITKACEHLFEAKFRLGDGFSSTEEIIHVSNIRALLTLTTQKRIEPLLAQILAYVQTGDLFKGTTEESQALLLSLFPKAMRRGIDKDLPTWTPSETDWQTFFHSTTSTEHLKPILRTAQLGWLAAKADLSQSDCSLLSLYDYMPDLIQIYRTLQLDIHLEPSFDPSLAEKTKYILSYIEHQSGGALHVSGGKGSGFQHKILRFDNHYKDARALTEYYHHLHLLTSADGTQPCPSAPPRLAELDERRFSQQFAYDDASLLSSSLIDWKRQEFFVQCTLHPEHTLYLAFPSIPRASLWFTQKVSEARQGLRDPNDEEELTKAIQAAQAQDLRQNLRAIEGRLQFDCVASNLSEPGQNPHTTIKVHAGESEAGGFYYYPWGLPGELGAWTPAVNPDVEGPLDGSTLPELLMPTFEKPITLTDYSTSLPHSPMPPRIQVSSKQLAIWATESPSLELGDPVYEVLLSSLNPVSSKGIIACFDFIRAHPDKLENPLIQDHLSHCIYRSDFLNSCFYTETEPLADFIKTLPELIATAKKKNNIQTASFLMHLSERLRDQARRTQEDIATLRRENCTNLDSLGSTTHNIRHKWCPDERESLQALIASSDDSIERIRNACPEDHRKDLTAVITKCRGKPSQSVGKKDRETMRTLLQIPLPDNIREQSEELRKQIAEKKEEEEEEANFLIANRISFAIDRLKKELEQLLLPYSPGLSELVESLNEINHALSEITSQNTDIPQRDKLLSGIEHHLSEILSPTSPSDKSWLLQQVRSTTPTMGTLRAGLYLLLSYDETTLAGLPAGELTQLLSLWQCISDSSSSLPCIGLLQAVYKKMEEVILPAVDARLRGDNDLQQKILSSLTQINSLLWIPVAGEEYVYHIPSANGRDEIARINLRTGEVLSTSTLTRSGASKEYRRNLPVEILDDPHYIQVFGNNAFKCSLQNTGTQHIYTFLLGGKECQIAYDPIARTISRISREFGTQWHDHVMTSSTGEDSNITQLLQSHGFWLNRDHPELGYLILEDLTKHKSDSTLLEDRTTLRLSLTADQKLLKVTTADGKKEVCTDTAKSLTSVIHCCHESDVLFLRSPDSSTIDEILFLKENFRLQREGTRWVPSNKEVGWSVALDPPAELVERFGQGYDQYMLPLVKNAGIPGKEEYELRLWPHEILPATRDSAGTVHFTHNKIPPTSVLSQQITISIDSQGQMHTSHAGFLYLALICQSQGKIEEATYYLEQMSGPRAFQDKGQAALFTYLSDQLLSLPIQTDLSAACLLKAHLATTIIKKEQYKIREFQELDWEQYQAKTERILTLCERYQTFIAKPGKEDSLVRSLLLLTNKETDELLSIQSMAIETMLKLPTSRAAQPRPILQAPKTASNEVMLPFILLMQQPDPKMTLETWQRSGMPLTAELLRNFWSYWQLIQTTSITPEQLLPLFQTIPADVDPALRDSIDLARKCLIELAMLAKQDRGTITSLRPPDKKIFSSLAKLLSQSAPIRTGFFAPIQRLLDARALALHETSKQQALRACQEQFRSLFTQFGTIFPGKQALFLDAEMPSVEELETTYTLGELEEKITDSALPPPEKKLYMGAIASIRASGGSAEGKLSKTKFLKTLHDARVPVTAKRFEARTAERIAQLENALLRSAAPESDGVSVKSTFLPIDLTQFSEQFDNKKTLREQFFSKGFYRLSPSEITITESFLHATPKQKRIFLEQYQNISQGRSPDPRAIKSLEHRLIQLLTQALEIPQENLPQNTSNIKDFITALNTAYEEAISSRETQTITEHCDKLLAACPEISSKTDCMAAHGREGKRAGIKEVAKKRKDDIEQAKTGVITMHSLPRLEQTLQDEVSYLAAHLEQRQSAILAEIEPFAERLGLFTQFSRRELFGDKEIFHAILDLYQNGGLNKISDPTKQAALEQKITEFLIIGTKLHLYENVLDAQAGSLTQLKALFPSIHKLEEQIADLRAHNQPFIGAQAKLDVLIKEWKSTSNAILSKIDRANDALFFCNTESKQLVDQEITRPMLVFSYRQKIGMRDEQRTMIKTLLDDPHALVELRMGLGKSSVIFPLVASLLADRKGTLPVVVFTEELVEQSRKDLDKRAYEFSFRRSPSLSARELSEEYKTLLELKSAGKFIVTTVNRLAALKNKFHEQNKVFAEKREQHKAKETALTLERAKSESDRNPDLIASLESEGEALFDQVVELSNQLLYLRKIHSLLFANADTRFLVDEPDEVLSILSEQNYADGQPQNISTTTFDVGEMLFQRLFNEESATPEISVLRNAFLENTQASLSEEALQAAMESLADKAIDAFLRDPLNQAGMQGAELSDDDRASLRAFLADSKGPNGTPAPRPNIASLPDAGTSQAIHIAATRFWLTKTLPLISRKSYGSDFGISADGFSVTPRKEEREKLNTKFGQEAELTAYHFLAYMKEGITSESFFETLLREIASTASAESEDGDKRWTTWLTTLQRTPPNTDIHTLFTRYRASTQEGRNLRAGSLRYIMQNGNWIRFNQHQITCRAGDVVGDCKFAGSSGTVGESRYTLNPSFTGASENVEPDRIAGDLLMRLSDMDLEGINAAIETPFSDSFTQMQSLLADSACKAIINLGSTSPGETTLTIIDRLRQTSQGRNKQFIFIHPEEKTAYIWHPGSAKPQRFDKVRDAKAVDPSKCIYYFAQADTRGTDFKIPPGYGALITGPTTTSTQMAQGIWRLRGLGIEHSAKYFIHTSIAKRINPSYDPSNPAVIQVKDVIQDIDNQTIREQSFLNVKAQASRAESIARMHMEKALLDPRDDQLQSFLELRDLSNTKEREAFLARVDVEVSLFEATKSYFFSSREMDYAPYYESARDLPTTEYIEQTYKKKRDAVATTKSDLTTKLTEISSTDEKAKARLAASIERCQKAADAIDEAKNTFGSSAEMHRKHLPPTMATNASLDSGSESEIQQEQQMEQQMQQMLATETTSAIRRVKRASCC